ncbi:MAG TPA: metallophosphoesterase family protein [Tepidisphaeraceae bacterium]|nr:metallophosphoesterase family protein [Tepidisphaeraceae bacterium]
MKSTWFIADTHFGHANIIRYSKRPFTDVSAHDLQLIQNWNDHVKAGDDVFHLGDFAYGKRDGALKIFEQLNGTIFLIEGNHDSIAHQIRDRFAWYDKVKLIKVNERRIFLSHYAHRVWEGSHHGVWHLYGHSHASLPDDAGSLSFDVGVDNTAIRLGSIDHYGRGTLPDSGLQPQDYRPIHFDEVEQVMARKSFIPIDHHGRDRKH